MIQDTISKIEERLRQSGSLSPETRQELLKLLASLKTEITEFSKTNTEQAQSIAGFTQASAHEATRTEKNPELLEHAVGGLEKSVEGFEESHPQLVQLVNRIATILSNLGI